VQNYQNKSLNTKPEGSIPNLYTYDNYQEANNYREESSLADNKNQQKPDKNSRGNLYDPLDKFKLEQSEKLKSEQPDKLKQELSKYTSEENGKNTFRIFKSEISPQLENSTNTNFSSTISTARKLPNQLSLTTSTYKKSTSKLDSQ
jgi:hypothetical protein